MEVVINRPDLFPPSTVVGVYPEGAVTDTARPPSSGPLIATKIVGDTGEVAEEKPVINPALTSVAWSDAKIVAGRNYVMGGQVNGSWVYLRFSPGKKGASLSPPARFPSHVAA